MSAMAVLTTLLGYRLAAFVGQWLDSRADHVASSALTAVGAGVIVGLL